VDRASADARGYLAEHLPVTPLVEASNLSRRVGHPVHLKLESLLPTGSFKVRGALWALHRQLHEGPVASVVASSTGNHGAAVAWAADRLGVPATIFLPENPNPVKRARIAGLGARIVEEGADIAAAWRRAERHARESGGFFLNDATDPNVPAGPGALALEALEQAPGLRTFVVPMGDTALIRGVARAVRSVRPHLRIVGVQAAGAPAYALSWRSGKVVTTRSVDTVADGLATRTPVAENVEEIRREVDDVVLVGDADLLAAVRFLALEEGFLAEPAGAAAAAALLYAGASDPSGGGLVTAEGAVCALVTGRNIPETLLLRALATDATDEDGGS
jgi:threonine dehydratase